MRNRILSLLFLLPFISESVSAALVEEKDYVAYLFTYFTGNHISEEAVCYVFQEIIKRHIISEKN